jgi:hypothetical protein
MNCAFKENIYLYLLHINSRFIFKLVILYKLIIEMVTFFLSFFFVKKRLNQLFIYNKFRVDLTSSRVNGTHFATQKERIKNKKKNK